MADLSADVLERYLESVLGEPVRVASVTMLGEPIDAGAEKKFGYGRPMRIAFTAGGRQRRAVLHTMKPGPFGHDDMADRARILLWSHRAFNALPRHVRSLDVGAFDRHGMPRSVADADEFFLLTDFVEGREYGVDMVRLEQGGDLEQRDVDRADALCDYLADIHRKPGPDPQLYVRRIRELVGDGECIMGLADSYPADHPIATPARLAAIERRAVTWRWRLKRRTDRLRQVHGDFHPWNILFAEDGVEFHLLDRSRGQWGDPADDVTCLTTNYLFSSVQRFGRLDGPLRTLFERFWSRYLAATGDGDMLAVAAPFYAFRGLVVASPVWYPDMPDAVRAAMLRFIENVLAADRFDPQRVNDYLEG